MLARQPRLLQPLVQYAQALEGAVDPSTRAAGQSLRNFVAEVLEAAQEWREARTGSGAGTSEPTLVAQSPSSGSPPGLHLTVVSVAERLQLSDSYVRRMCREEVLSATNQGGAWLIDEASVAEFEQKRSSR